MPGPTWCPAENRESVCFGAHSHTMPYMTIKGSETRQVQLPMCAGASTLWRSTTTGWENVDSVIFDDCCATVTLDHFCDLVITGERVPLKGLGFLHPQGGHAQIVVMHVGCNFCQRGLELLCSDDDALKRLCRCGPSLQLGTYRHNEELEIYQAGKKSTMKILFDRLPLPCRVYAQSGLQFDVEIRGQNHHFEFEVPIRSATPAPQLAPSPHPSAGSASQAGQWRGVVFFSSNHTCYICGHCLFGWLEYDYNINWQLIISYVFQ